MGEEGPGRTDVARVVEVRAVEVRAVEARVVEDDPVPEDPQVKAVVARMADLRMEGVPSRRDVPVVMAPDLPG